MNYMKHIHGQSQHKNLVTHQSLCSAQPSFSYKSAENQISIQHGWCCVSAVLGKAEHSAKDVRVCVCTLLWEK